jgi:hypothetical protein
MVKLPMGALVILTMAASVMHTNVRVATVMVTMGAKVKFTMGASVEFFSATHSKRWRRHDHQERQTYAPQRAARHRHLLLSHHHNLLLVDGAEVGLSLFASAR